MFHPRSKHLTLEGETDSRGFTVVRDGDVGGHGPASQAVSTTFGKRCRSRTQRQADFEVVLASDGSYTSPGAVPGQDVVMSIDGMNQRLGDPPSDR